METKFLPMEVKGESGSDARYRTLEGYGSVFGNVDDHYDVIDPGAFTASLAVKEPKMVWQHNMSQLVGRWDEYVEDAHGLRLKGRIAAQTERGRDAAELVEMGALQGLSIGFVTIKEEMDGRIRRLKEIDLWEVSLVSVPANAKALITDIKSKGDIRSFEAMLREHGFSRSDAKCIASKGFNAWASQREADGMGGDAEGLREAVAAANSIKQTLERIAQ